jgi:predicted kinase
MHHPLLLIVSGLPCAGKTSIAERFAAELSLPLMTKDGIKEQLFYTLGWKDRDWSRKLSKASVELLLYFTESQLAAGNSLIIECNFQPDLAAPRLRAMQARFAAALLQVYCRADTGTLYERFKARTGTRHAGHVDEQYLAEFQEMLDRTPQETMDLGCPVVVVDTTDFQKVDYPTLIKAVRDVQGAAQAQR